MYLGVNALLLILVSLLMQGPIPVCQAAIGAKGVRQAAIVTIMTSVVGAAGFVLLVLLPYGPAFTQPEALDATTYLAAGGAGVLYAAANMLMYWAAPIIGSTHFGLVFTLRVVPLALISMLPPVSESLTWQKMLGIVLILAGVWHAKMLERRAVNRQPVSLVKEKKTAKPTPKQIRWAWAGAIAGTVLFGSANAFDAVVVQQVDTATYVPIRLLLPVLLIGAGLQLTRKRAAEFDIRAFVRQRRWSLLGVAVFVPVSASTFMWAVQLSDQPTLLGSIHQLSLFPTILIGAWVTGGKSGSLKEYWPPTAVCIAGVALALGLAG